MVRQCLCACVCAPAFVCLRSCPCVRAPAFVRLCSCACVRAPAFVACVRAPVFARLRLSPAFVRLRSRDCVWATAFGRADSPPFFARLPHGRIFKISNARTHRNARSGVFLNSFFAVISGGFLVYLTVGSSSYIKSAHKTAFKRAKHLFSDRKSFVHRTRRICRNKGFKRGFPIPNRKAVFSYTRTAYRCAYKRSQHNDNGPFALTRSRPDPPQKAKCHKLRYNKLKYHLKI